ncbi:MAG: hypothetical protein A2806_03685 [Candidatus Terrybacteria bacterium RIFCSPHIGHO2_01_FULL_48_17]|uniref:Uncharacterized protein n=1 Tax=Candidatus Terrybacteria bacterium RIFCSPHIGHO2_01_FULL_48_17 TaxID=1802362 RepID=A0A1G2PIT0_9BACT|nr:MAG: hypothetical protein A2806_03685 [Candidatus Terrybacteria bacterium RIFCSPHIGHO2_01_FULL_48_17]OHA52126.1 MAG: hypothetical protein A3A30_02305 [Candidatus Terrybacteria bacterium RIFCSPLOWO2_01_FULL_48_14]
MKNQYKIKYLEYVSSGSNENSEWIGTIPRTILFEAENDEIAKEMAAGFLSIVRSILAQHKNRTIVWPAALIKLQDSFITQLD